MTGEITPASFVGVSRDMVQRECEGILDRHARSFSLAALFLGKRMRKDAAVCYAFCRMVDDAVDEAPDQRAAERGLQTIEDMLEGRTRPSAIVAAYVEAATRLGFGLDPARDLILGARSDLDCVRIESDEAFLQYCYRVAGTVGLMMCGVLGVTEPNARRHAIDLGIAMQMTNICRDVLEDAERGRVYLPDNRLVKEEINQADIVAAPSAQRPALVRGTARVVEHVLDWAEYFYASGRAGYRHIPFRARLAIEVAGALYREIGEVLRRRNCDVFRGRVAVSRTRKFVLLVRSVANWFMGITMNEKASTAYNGARLLAK